MARIARKYVVWTSSLALTLAILLVQALPARADYETGQQAWNAGRFTEAVTEWQAAAAAGDGRAMLALGRAFVKGLGVPQDYVEAHKWLNLAAARGDAQSAAERDALAQKMTVEEQAEARRLARAWQPGGGMAPDAREAAAPPVTAEDPGPPPVEALREAQALLAVLGYDPGPADGIWGRRSVQAYQSFLRDAGQPLAEKLTPQALHAMRAIAERHGVEADVAAGGESPASAATVPSKPTFPPDALHRAVKAGDLDGLKAAIKAGANLDGRDDQGWTALMHAANKGHVPFMQQLLDAKADIDAQALDDATALFMAAVHGHSAVIALLMKAGAETSVRGPNGMTAVDVARVRYGELYDARKRKEDVAVLALLQGTTVTAAEKTEELIRKYPRGKKLSDCEQCPELVVVPAGSFMMGSPLYEEGRSDNEDPQHRVMIGAPFAVGIHEVTFAEWDACVTDGTCDGLRTHDKNWGRGRRPVINVTWNDAKTYTGWLSAKTGEQYRLLSEAEWEYVARAGTTDPFHYGTTISTDQANYSGSKAYGKGEKGAQRKKTLPVGTFPGNIFGLHDVHGNVAEWIEDCWHKNYEGAPVDGSAWTTKHSCNKRVLRGGSWANPPQSVRSAARGKLSSEKRTAGLGFRIARTLTP